MLVDQKTLSEFYSEVSCIYQEVGLCSATDKLIELHDAPRHRVAQAPNS